VSAVVPTTQRQKDATSATIPLRITRALANRGGGKTVTCHPFTTATAKSNGHGTNALAAISTPTMINTSAGMNMIVALSEREWRSSGSAYFILIR